MKTWIPQIQLYLDELLRREGRNGFVAEECQDCMEGEPGKAIYRCLGCSPAPLVCQKCLCRKHVQLPFYRIQVSLCPVTRSRPQF